MDSAASEPTPSPPLNEAAQSERWEIAAQWRLAWRALQWTAAGLAILLALVVAGQVFLYYEMFARLHGALGAAFALAIAGLAIWLIGVPAWRFFNAPVIAHPPAVDLSAEDISVEDVRRRLAFDDAYLKTIAANPAQSGETQAATSARTELQALRAGLTDANVREAASTLAAFERDRIAVLMNTLDRDVDAYIRKEALAIGAATAVSLNGSVDAFIVLWRNINMVSRIARLYYGRPNLRISMMILRDVALAVILSRVADDVSETAGEVLAGVMTRLGGIVAGPVLDGAVNALMTLKLGYLAKRRCRSFDVWSEASALSATRDVLDRVQKESAGLVADLVKAIGGVAGAAASAAEKIASAPKSAWSLMQRTFARKTPPAGAE